MSTIETQTPAAEKPIGRVETDMFCSACHYNLYGLDVHRDLRLDIPILRCPECGKFHAAGIATGAGRIWLSRLARMLIALWIFFILGVIVACGLAFFIENAAGLDVFIHRNWDGQLQMRLTLPSDWPSPWGYYFAHAMMIAIAGATGLLLGAFLATIVWHAPRIRLFLAIMLPPLAGLLVGVLWSDGTGRYADGIGLAVHVLTWIGLVQCAGIAMGIWLGRAVSRLLLRAFLTRKLLQHVRFLWEVDGKDAPSLDHDQRKPAAHA